MLRRLAAALAIALAAAPAWAGSEALRAPERLTVGLADELLGQLAPDGRHLYFISNRNATNQIFVQDLEAPGSQLLFDEEADVTWPRVSPDGKSLLYISFRDDAAGQLCVRDLKKLARRCLAGEGGAVQAEWLPGGAIALSSRGADLHGDLRLLRVSTGKTLTATPWPWLNLTSPAVSPDGRWLVYVPIERYADRVGVGFAARTTKQLGVVRLDQPNAKPAALALALPGASGQPSFSPDGKYLYFTQYLDDNNGDEVIDGGDHGVLFRLAWPGDPARTQAAVPEQLTNGSWNCQYPSPSAARLVMTCARGSLDLYSLPLDGVVPSEWTSARLREELHASRKRWEQLLVLAHLLRLESSPAARAALTMDVIRMHLLVGESESAQFFVQALAALDDAATAGVAPVILEQLAHRRAERGLERGRMSARFVEEGRRRIDGLTAGDAAAPPAARALRALVRSEIADTIGDKEAARRELASVAVDAAAPRFVLHALAERADALYRELDERDALVAIYKTVADHPSLDEAERVRYALAGVRALTRGLSGAESLAAVERELARAGADSDFGFALLLERSLLALAPERAAEVQAALIALYHRQRSVERRRALIVEAVERAAAHELPRLVEELARVHVGDVARGTTERRRAERLYRVAVEERAYGELGAGRRDAARADFLSVTELADSLESHVSLLELRLGEGEANLEADYDRRFAERRDAPIPRFVRAYLLARKLPGLTGEAHARTLQQALDELSRASAGMKQKSELQALQGALLHERYLQTGALDAAEEANLHYLLALELAHEGPRYRAMILEQLARLQSAVGNHRIALGYYEEREALPFIDDRVALGHLLGKARTLAHIGRDADAAHAADDALGLARRSGALADFRALAIDRAALYNLAAGQFARAATLYAEAAPLVDAETGAGARRNRLCNRIGHAAAALGAGQPAAALADLVLVDGWLADTAQLDALRWPHATTEEVTVTYQLLALGLRARAHRELHQLPEAVFALETRRKVLAARFERTHADEDLAALAQAEAQLAVLARARKDLGAAARWTAAGIDHADTYGRKTATPIHPALLDLLSFAAELQLFDGAPAGGFGIDLPARLTAAFDAMAERRNPAWRAAQRRFALYLSLLRLQ